MAHNVAQLGQHPVLEPAQQGRALAVGQLVGIISHSLLELRPVRHCGANIAQRGAERGLKRAAQLCVRAASLKIDHRFTLFTSGRTFDHFGQQAIRIAADRQNRVDQAVNR